MFTIKDIARILIAQHKVRTDDAEGFIAQMIEVINEGLVNDRQVKIKGFGTFKLQTVKERDSISVSTGERVTIGEHDKVTFTPDSVMRDLVNKPFAQFETVIIEDDSLLLDDSTESEMLTDDEVAIKDADNDIAPIETVAKETVAATASALLDTNGNTSNEDNEETIAEDDSTSEEEAKLIAADINTAISADDVVNIEDTETPGDTENIESAETADRTDNVEDTETIMSENEEIVSTAQVLEEIKEDDDIEEKEEEQEETIQDSNEEEEIEQEETETDKEEETEEDVETDDDKDEGDKDEGEEVEEKEEKKEEIEKEEEEEKEEDDEDDDYDYDEDEQHSPMYYCLLSGISCALLFFAIGYYACMNGWLDRWFPRSDNQTVSQQDSISNSPVQALPADTISLTDTTKASTNSVSDTKEQDKEQEKEHVSSMDEYNKKDTRVKTGAWVIVGTETEVTVREGQTLKSISKAYLGPDMECYVEVYNDKKSVKAGDVIKIPKLKPKKQLRR